MTGGTGFLGSALVRRLVNDRRTRARARQQLARRCGPPSATSTAGSSSRGRHPRCRTRSTAPCEGVDAVCHLAFINGTEFFYTKPELVLDVAVKGIINVLDGAIRHRVPELMVMSSSEVYHEPATRSDRRNGRRFRFRTV